MKSLQQIEADSLIYYPIHPLYQDTNKEAREGFIKGQLMLIKDLSNDKKEIVKIKKPKFVPKNIITNKPEYINKPRIEMLKDELKNMTVEDMANDPGKYNRICTSIEQLENEQLIYKR